MLIWSWCRPKPTKICMVCHFSRCPLAFAATGSRFSPLTVHLARLSIAAVFLGWLTIQLSTGSCCHLVFTMETRQHTLSCSFCYCHGSKSFTLLFTSHVQQDLNTVSCHPLSIQPAGDTKLFAFHCPAHVDPKPSFLQTAVACTVATCPLA